MVFSKLVAKVNETTESGGKLVNEGNLLSPWEEGRVKWRCRRGLC